MTGVPDRRVLGGGADNVPVADLLLEGHAELLARVKNDMLATPAVGDANGASRADQTALGGSAGRRPSVLMQRPEIHRVSGGRAAPTPGVRWMIALWWTTSSG